MGRYSTRNRSPIRAWLCHCAASAPWECSTSHWMLVRTTGSRGRRQGGLGALLWWAGWGPAAQGPTLGAQAQEGGSGQLFFRLGQGLPCGGGQGYMRVGATACETRTNRSFWMLARKNRSERGLQAGEGERAGRLFPEDLPS